MEECVTTDCSKAPARELTRDEKKKALKLKILTMTPERIRSLERKIGEMKQDLTYHRALCRGVLKEYRKGKFNTRKYTVWLMADYLEDLEELVALWERLYYSD